MFLHVTTPGGFELLYEAACAALNQLPQVFQLLSSLPVVVTQLLLLFVIFFGLDFITDICMKIADFIKRLNDKL